MAAERDAPSRAEASEGSEAPATPRPHAPAGFINAEVPLDALPAVDDVDWMPLHRRFARRLQVAALIRSIIFVAVGWAAPLAAAPGNRAAIAEALPWLPVFFWTTLGLFCAWSVAWPLIAVPRRGYAVREKDLLYKSGVFWRSVRAFPFNRVQHTKLDSTPLDRRFGLASVSVFPAGGGRGHRIRGLGRETAERLRVYISARIEAGAEPEEADAEPETAGESPSEAAAGP